MKKIIILSSVLLIAIAVIAVKYFSELTGNSNNNTKVLKYIPSDATLIVNFSNDDYFYDIIKDYTLFDELIGEKRSVEISQLRSMLLKQPLIAEEIKGQKIFISFHKMHTDSLDYLFSMGMKESVNPAEAERLLKSCTGVKYSLLPQSDTYKLEFKNLKRPFFLHFLKGAVFGSYSNELLDKAVDSKDEKISSEFVSLINKEIAKTQSTPINLFVNKSNLASFVLSFMKGKATGNTVLLKGLSGYAALGMNFKSDALMFNGNSIPDTTGANYLNTFLHQHPVKNQLKDFLPVNTANFITFGISNFKVFHQDLTRYFTKRAELEKLQNQLQALHTEKGFDLEHNLLPKFGNEFMIFETAQQEKLGMIKLTNGTAVDASLQAISSKSSSFISQINYSNLLYYCLGEPMRSFPKPYFRIIDNILIIANSQGAITRYMDHYNAGSFIAKSKEFKDHDQLVATKSNISFFAETQNSSRLIGSRLKNRYAALFKDEEGLDNFYGLSVQWSSAGSYFQTNIYANYNTSAKKAFKKVWSFKMNARIASAPAVFNDGDRQIILVQDNVYNLYALSDEGKRIWATQLPGTIRGELHQLNDESILFNTEDKIYRIHPDGTALEGYPVSLPQKTIYGLTLTGTDPAQSQLFIAAQNKIIAYTLAGKELEGWNKNMPAKLCAAPLYAEVGNLQYIIAGTQTGEFFFFNAMNGSLIHQVKENTVVTQFKNNLFPVLSENADDSWIVTTDTAGVLHEIPFNGALKRTSVGVWDENHVFGYKNITGDSNPEYIYLDNKSLSVLNRDNTTVFSYEFENPSKNNLQFFTADQGTWNIAVSSYQKNELYLFDNDGNLSKGFPVKGTGEFYMGTIRNDGLRYLICGSNDGYLYAYKL